MAKIIYYRHPEAQDRRLSIGDACPMVGSCEGHPGNSHSGLMTFDMNYYTHGPSNTTQYSAGSPGDVENEHVWIWERGLGWTDGGLLTDVFDWQRNYEFWCLVKRFYPSARIMISSSIYDYVRYMVAKTYGSGLADKFTKMISQTKNGSYNHHIHAHIDLWGDPDMGASVGMK